MFCTRARSCARADDAKIVRSRNAQCKTRESPNLVPRAHVPFGQHQDTELWNNQFPETKILGFTAHAWLGLNGV